MSETVPNRTMGYADVMRIAAMSGLGATYATVVRRCPRCNKEGWHSAHRSKPGVRHVVMISCAECGYGWRGRFLRNEWNDNV